MIARIVDGEIRYEQQYRWVVMGHRFTRNANGTWVGKFYREERPACTEGRCAKPAAELHECPYDAEVNSDCPDRKMCDCCAACRQQCVDDI